ncbi:MAG TPA: Co2+/Mg2+ efflux protein ApaG [Saprospiraceae bacterium]|nr:Co2+/Mg2+ efflux protein ApaG [Saprospiraceae bacterium]
MHALTTNGVRIGVESNFQPGHSFPHRSQYLHVYTIHIKNYNEYPIQLISRHWDITEADGTKKVVDGQGVVGEQPLLDAGGLHSYSSFCVLAFPIGKMSGFYTMVRMDTGEQFNVDIPAFNLVMPDALN